MPTPLYHGCLW